MGRRTVGVEGGKMAAAMPWKQAASIILLSRSSRRVLFLRRGETAAFMPGALVFPGGVVNEEETSGEAALRELFEETGVLSLEGKVEVGARDGATARMQDAVNEKGAPPARFRELIGSRPLSHSSLVPWSTWLTPNARHYRRRFMTDFFVLPIEDEVDIRPCTREMAGAEWLEPSAVLSAAASARASVPPPQQYEISRLKDADPHRLVDYRIRKVLFPQLLVAEESDSKLLCNVLPGDQSYVTEGPGQFSAGTRTVPVSSLLHPDPSKPLHRLTYSSSPMYSQCRIDVRGVDPLEMEEPRC